MIRTLALAIVAISMSACQHTYVDAGLSVADSGVEQFAFDSTGRVFAYSHNSRNPYGFLAVGYELPVTSRCSLSGAIRHESSLATDRDRGVNSVQAHARCWLNARNGQ